MMPTELKIFSGFGFDSDSPYFTFDQLENGLLSRKKVKIIGNDFTIKLLPARYCIGRYDLKTFDSFTCPNCQLLNGKESVCYDCFKFNSFNPSFYNVPTSQLSSKQIEYNLSPHNVYLAYFSKSQIKVGISHHLRNDTRWLEQGARIATVLYRCKNAYDAREIEEKISSSLKLSESFRADQKRQVIKDPLIYEDATKCFDDLKHRIEMLLNEKPLESEYVNLEKKYMMENKIQPTIIDISNESPLIVSGTGLGLIGDTLIFTNLERQFMVSLKKIISHEIHIDNQLIKQDFTPMQISLF